MGNSNAAFTDPLMVNKSADGTIAVNGRDFRHGLGGLAAPSEGSSYGHTSGVFPSGSPVGSFIADLSVGPTTPSPAMRTLIAPGAYQIARGAEGPYIGAVMSGVVVDHLPANGTFPRLDLVVIRTKDPGVDGTTIAESGRPVVLAGSPAAAPTSPTNLLEPGDLVLSRARVRAGATSILQTDLTDLRVFVTARGGIYPRGTADTRPGSYEGQYRDDAVLNELQRWNGGGWEAVASPAQWSTFTPRLIAAGTGTDISIGSGARYIGRYKVLGKRCDFSYFFQWGAKPFNGGVGDIFSYLPPGIIAAGYNQWCQAHLWVNDAYVGDFFGQALIQGSQYTAGNTIRPFFSIHAGNNSNTKPYRIATSGGQANSGIPQIYSPDGFPQGGDLALNGSIEVV